MTMGKFSVFLAKMTGSIVVRSKAIVVFCCNAAAIYAGKLAAYWNLPHFSFLSTNPELMDKTMFSTLVRVMSPFNHLATALRHVFNFFGVSISLFTLSVLWQTRPIKSPQQAEILHRDLTISSHLNFDLAAPCDIAVADKPAQCFSKCRAVYLRTTRIILCNL